MTTQRRKQQQEQQQQQLQQLRQRQNVTWSSRKEMRGEGGEGDEVKENLPEQRNKAGLREHE